MERLRIEAMEVNIDFVQPNPWNPKDAIEDSPENAERFEQVKKGMLEHGLMMPIAVRRKGKNLYEIIDGFHRYKACKELGYTIIGINDLGEMSDEVAKALTIFFEKARIPTNPTKEAELLKGIYDVVGDYQEMAKILPYDAQVIQDKVELVNFDWNSLEKDKGADGEGNDHKEDSSFKFKVPHADIEMCNKALAETGEERDAAFVEICRFYNENHKFVPGDESELDE